MHELLSLSTFERWSGSPRRHQMFTSLWKWCIPIVQPYVDMHPLLWSLANSMVDAGRAMGPIVANIRVTRSSNVCCWQTIDSSTVSSVCCCGFGCISSTTQRGFVSIFAVSPRCPSVVVGSQWAFSNLMHPVRLCPKLRATSQLLFPSESGRDMKRRLLVVNALLIKTENEVKWGCLRMLSSKITKKWSTVAW